MPRAMMRESIFCPNLYNSLSEGRGTEIQKAMLYIGSEGTSINDALTSSSINCFDEWDTFELLSNYYLLLLKDKSPLHRSLLCPSGLSVSSISDRGGSGYHVAAHATARDQDAY